MVLSSIMLTTCGSLLEIGMAMLMDTHPLHDESALFDLMDAGEFFEKRLKCISLFAIFVFM